MQSAKKTKRTGRPTKSPKPNKGPILIISVGNDERPAGQVDIDSIAKVWEKAKDNPDRTVVTHNAISFQSLEPKCWNAINVIKLGSNDRPVGVEDMDDFILSLEKAEKKTGTNRYLITALQVEVIQVAIAPD